MATPRRMRFIYGILAWMLSTIFVLVVLNSLSYELFFLLSVLGVLIVTGLTTPIAVTPDWRRRLRWIILAGLAGFVVIVIRRIIEILPPEVLP